MWRILAGLLGLGFWFDLGMICEGRVGVCFKVACRGLKRQDWSVCRLSELWLMCNSMMCFRPF